MRRTRRTLAVAVISFPNNKLAVCCLQAPARLNARWGRIFVKRAPRALPWAMGGAFYPSEGTSWWWWIKFRLLGCRNFIHHHRVGLGRRLLRPCGADAGRGLQGLSRGSCWARAGSRGALVVLPWGSRGARVGLAWGSRGDRAGRSWCSRGVRVGLAWGSRGALAVLSGGDRSPLCPGARLGPWEEGAAPRARWCMFAVDLPSGVLRLLRS